jgi:hypothetical protein
MNTAPGKASHQGEMTRMPIENPVTATAAMPVAKRAFPNWLYCRWARASLSLHALSRAR